MIVRFRFNVKCNFIICIDRARICFKCYIEKERKCSFENALVEHNKSSNNLK